MSYRYDCGTPFQECTGSEVEMKEAGNRRKGEPAGRFKLHSDQDSARKCPKAYCARRSAEGRGVYLPSKPQRVKRGKNPQGAQGSRRAIPAFRG